MKPWVLVVLLCACGGGGTTGLSPQPRDEDYLVRSAILRQLYELSGDEANSSTVELEYAREQDRADCMTARGFDYVPAPVESLIVLGPALNPLDPRFVEKYGFGISTIAPEPARIVRNPNDETFEKLASAEQNAWVDALTACQPTPDSSNRERRLRSAVTSLYDVKAGVATDREVVAAAVDYAECLERRGFGAAGRNPAEVQQFVLDKFRADVTEGDTPPEVFARFEIALATANLDCGTALRDVETAHLRSAIETSDSTLFALLYEPDASQ